ncbi:hypothetical protein BJ742DRAFT_158436 [Cladochytrium replicatum]|nr:hypothetical protein BJ742DRAFT_158436 [Cladochytrium replicatum]
MPGNTHKKDKDPVKAAAAAQEAAEKRGRKIRRHLLGRKVARPVLPKNGLSVVERVFYKTPYNRPQVVIAAALKLYLPPAVQHYSVARLVDLVRVVAASHYRLSTYIDPKTLTLHHFADTADKLPVKYRVVQR